jgi:hypothetical protein
MITKRCRTCKELKNVDLFFKNSHNVDGLDNHCKICTSKRKKELYEKRKNALPKDKIPRKSTPRWNVNEIEKEQDEVQQYKGLNMGFNRLINIPKEILRGVTK